MRKSIFIICVACAGLLAFGIGCSKSDAPASGKPSGASAPEEVVKNFAAAVARKDAPAAVACFSKAYIAESAKYIRSDLEKNPDKLEKQGLASEDLKLSDEKLLEKILSKKYEKDSIDTEAASELTILDKKIEGDRGTVIVKDKKKETLLAEVVKEDGVWKLGKIEPAPPKKIAPYDALLSIGKAQEKYKSNHDAYGMLANLREEGLLEKIRVADSAGGYDLSEEVPTVAEWRVTLFPDDPDKMDTFRIDQTGIIKVKHPGTDDFVNYEK